jgi:hypothetical protein
VTRFDRWRIPVNVRSSHISHQSDTSCPPLQFPDASSAVSLVSEERARTNLNRPRLLISGIAEIFTSASTFIFRNKSLFKATLSTHLIIIDSCSPSRRQRQSISCSDSRRTMSPPQSSCIVPTQSATCFPMQIDYVHGFAPAFPLTPSSAPHSPSVSHARQAQPGLQKRGRDDNAQIGRPDKRQRVPVTCCRALSTWLAPSEPL